MNISVDTYHWY